MIRRPPRSTPLYSSAASDVYKRQFETHAACNAAAINGTWVAVQTSLVGETHNGRCNVKIANGNLTGTCNMLMASGPMLFDVSGPVTVGMVPFNDPGNADNGFNLCSATVAMNFSGGQSTFNVALAKNGVGWTGTWTNNWGVQGISTAFKQ